MRKITIYLRDYVDDSRRRERRRGTIVAIGAVLVTLFAAGAFRPAATEEKPDKTDTTQTTATTQTSVTTPPTDTTHTTDTTPAIDTTGTPTIVTTPATLSVTPGRLEFTGQLPGTRSDAGLVTVRNDGDEPLSITKVDIGKVNNEGPFDWTNGCTALLPRGGKCSVAVVFRPMIPGTQTGALVIDSNGGTATISLTGTGRPFPPLDLGTIDFGRQLINTHVPPRTVRFSNKSAFPIEVVTRSITPDNSPFAVIGEPCGYVAPSDGCDVTIVFTPQTGESKAELQIFDPYKNLLAFAHLTGGGYQGQINFNPALIQRPATKKPPPPQLALRSDFGRVRRREAA